MQGKRAQATHQEPERTRFRYDSNVRNARAESEAEPGRIEIGSKNTKGSTRAVMVRSANLRTRPDDLEGILHLGLTLGRKERGSGNNHESRRHGSRNHVGAVEERTACRGGDAAIRPAHFCQKRAYS